MTYFLPSQTCLMRYKYNNKTSAYFTMQLFCHKTRWRYMFP